LGGEIYILDFRSQENTKNDYPLPEEFTSKVFCHYRIDKGTPDKLSELKMVIDELCRKAKRDIITLH
jgi:hypothetical protein